MSTLQEMLAQSPNGELDELSQHALTLYRENPPEAGLKHLTVDRKEIL